MIFVRTKPGKFEGATFTSHLGFAFEENHMIILTSSFSKAPFENVFRHDTKAQSQAMVFKFLRFEERFRKAAFS